MVALLAYNGVAVAQYNVYSNGVPDVDKPVPADNSCWIASAANNLAAAGWGTGATVQQRADNIYNNDLMPHYGNGAWAGWSSVAINYWLLNHAYNPSSANYDPTINYNDTTIIRKRLIDVDYDWLLDELNQNPAQQVNVSFDIPTAEVGHEMTLVGGNYSPVHMPPALPPVPPQVSVWHDNQGDLTAPAGDDDEYTNIWFAGPFWNIDRHQTPGNPNDDWEAIGATTLCPGIPKPKSAIDNFDVAWYKDMVGPGTLVNKFRVAGASYGTYSDDQGGIDPYWVQDPTNPEEPELIIPNEERPDLHKEIWLSVDYIDRNHAGDPGITILAGDGISYTPDEILWSDDGGQVRLHWTLENQPAWEKLIFPNTSYRDLYNISTGLGGDVKDWNLATECVPEPATMSLLALGGLAVLRRRRRRA
jgi:hypothetical protein